MKYLVTVNDCPSDPSFISELTRLIKDGIRINQKSLNESDIDVRISCNQVDRVINPMSCIFICVSSIGFELTWEDKILIGQDISCLLYERDEKDSLAVVIHVF